MVAGDLDRHLLGAFVGLRTAEAVGLRVVGVDFMRRIVRAT
jgi:hypothetical protein